MMFLVPTVPEKAFIHHNAQITNNILTLRKMWQYFPILKYMLYLGGVTDKFTVGQRALRFSLQFTLVERVE